MGIVVVRHRDKESNCLGDLYWGLVGINHTGQECFGFVLSDGLDIHRERHEGLVRSRKQEDLVSYGYCGIGNVNSIVDHQPEIYDTVGLGIYGITFDGFIVNYEELRREVGETFSTPYQVELIGKLIGKGGDFLSGIENVAKKVIGPYCIGIVTKDGEVFAARGPLAIKPLIAGQSERGYGIITESKGLSKMGMNITRDLEPGEVVGIDDSGIHTLGCVEGRFGRKRKHCSFQYGYFAKEDSVIDGVPVNLVREKLAAILAEKDKGLEFDVVCSVPRSADAYAEGYAKASGHPLSFALIKDDYALRSYTRPTQEERAVEASQKLSVVRSRVEGKRIIVCDDSLRRGTQTEGGPVDMLRDAGAKEIHMRFGTPRNEEMCRFDERDRLDEKLPANMYPTDEEMAEYLRVDSVRFPELEDFVQVLTGLSGSEEDDFCWGCYKGGNFSFCGLD